MFFQGGKNMAGDSMLQGKRFIYDIIKHHNPKTGIDIGCGSGIYARMFPELDWTGIEIWEPYIDRFSLDRLYERFILGDARRWVPDNKYDIAIAGDVLEHMTKEEAKDLLDKLKSCSDVVLISLPVVYFPQGELEGNPYEKHVVDNWTVEDVIDAFGEPYWHGVEYPIGVFMWKGNEDALQL